MRATVRVEWDMGHRLPHHEGACARLHGHRYVAEVTVEGPVQPLAGVPDEGMVADFADVKRIANGAVAIWDHRFLVADHDPLSAQLAPLPGVMAVCFAPTAENIAAALLEMCRLQQQADRPPGGFNGPSWRFVAVRLWETPSCWVETE